MPGDSNLYRLVYCRLEYVSSHIYGEDPLASSQLLGVTAAFWILETLASWIRLDP